MGSLLSNPVHTSTNYIYREDNQMQIDLYTKGVLTVIALSLTVIACKQLLPRAHAKIVPQPVVICSFKASECVDVYNGKLKVRVEKY